MAKGHAAWIDTENWESIRGQFTPDSMSGVFRVISKFEEFDPAVYEQFRRDFTFAVKNSNLSESSKNQILTLLKKYLANN